MTNSIAETSRLPTRTIHLLTATLLMCCAIFLGAAKSTAQTGFAAERHARIVAQRRIFVRSTSLLVRGAVVEEKLLKRPEFKQLGFEITRDLSDADIVLELRHDLLTKYVFTVVDAKTLAVIAGGKVSSLGGTVADKVAKRFLKEMNAAGTP